MIFGKLQTYLLGAFGFLAVIVGAFLKGAANARQKQAMKEVEGYKETRERIDEANTVNRDADTARKWLRNRNQ